IALADSLPAGWPHAGDRKDRTPLAGIPRGRKDRAVVRYASRLLARPERNARGLHLAPLRDRPKYLCHLHRAGRLWRGPGVGPREAEPWTCSQTGKFRGDLAPDAQG